MPQTSEDMAEVHRLLAERRSKQKELDALDRAVERAVGIPFEQIRRVFIPAGLGTHA